VLFVTGRCETPPSAGSMQEQTANNSRHIEHNAEYNADNKTKVPSDNNKNTSH